METNKQGRGSWGRNSGQTTLWDMAYGEDPGPTQKNQGASVGFQAKDLTSHFHVYTCTRMCTCAPYV